MKKEGTAKTKQEYTPVRMWPQSYKRHEEKARKLSKRLGRKIKMPEYFDILSKEKGVPVRGIVN